MKSEHGSFRALHNQSPTEKRLPTEQMLTPKEVAVEWKISTSWLAKRRMEGDGPPYIKVGRSVRYVRAEMLQWMKSRQRLSTNQQ
jgi:predicted DNA-binding transcriptional regulator AlpA